ncbi:MAG: histidine phosphatase family protein [Pseudomonadota bacterium]
MKELFIIRHGETEWNVQQRMQGRLDSPLTEQGRSQADAHGTLLKSLGGLDRIWVSPAGRTTETAYIINSYAQATMEFAEPLLERDCGDWGGLTLNEIQDQYPEAWAARLQDAYLHKPPNGENLHDMLLRVHEFLDDLFGLDWARIGLITHGVMSKVILKYYLGLSEVECTRVRHPNDLLYRLTFHPELIESHHYINGQGPVDGLLRSDVALANLPQSQ